LKLTANIRPLSPTRVTFPEQRAKVRCACGMQGWAGWSPDARAAAVADPPAGATALVMQGPLPAGLLPSCLPNHSLLAHLAAVPCRATRAAQRCWMQCWGAGPWCASVSRSGGGGLAWAGMGWHGLAWAGMGCLCLAALLGLGMQLAQQRPACTYLPALPCLQPLTTCTWRCSRLRCGTPRPARQWRHRH
jgi:hypothetical protein